MTRQIRFTALPTEAARALRSGAPDANGLPAERSVSDGSGNPCRHCLRDIPKGAGMLVLAWRPFPTLQPYAELGPIFLCADDCPRWSGDDVPPILRRQGGERLVKAYSADDRIVYGLGKVVPDAAVPMRAAEILSDPRVAYAHVRSATNNCFTCRIDRA